MVVRRKVRGYSQAWAAASAVGGLSTCPLLWGSLLLALLSLPSAPALQGHVGCPGARVRMSCGSAGLGCQRGHNPGVLQTPGVSSSAATDTEAQRHTRAFWVDAVSKQTKVELQPTNSPPSPGHAVGFRLNPTTGCEQKSSSSEEPNQAKMPDGAGWEVRQKWNNILHLRLSYS